VTSHAVLSPTTVQIVAERFLNRDCGQTCVHWAIGLVEAGCESLNVAILAGMVPPYNHFEVAARRDLALVDLGVTVNSKDAAVRAFAAEQLRRVGDDDIQLRDVVRAVSDMCVADDHRADLFDFYLLDCAYDDLAEHCYPGHWPGATPGTIAGIVRVRIAQFLETCEAI
jgi:hypothetical protein